MFQRQNNEIDVFQILTFCLKSLKKKIVIFIKIYLRQESHYQQSDIYKQLIKQIYHCRKNVQLIKKEDNIVIQDIILFQRFVARVKQIARMYIVQASISQEIFLYLKKIQTFTFRQQPDFKSYIIFLFQQTPKFIKNRIQREQMNLERCLQEYQQEIKKEQFKRLKQQKVQINQCKRRVNKIIKHQQLDLKQIYAKKVQLKQINRQIKTQEKQRPIDILQKSIQNLDCLDCDISQFRTYFFQLNQDKQAIFQIERLMLNSNKFVKQTMRQYFKSYKKYKNRIIKSSNQDTKLWDQRCLTATVRKRDINFSTLSSHSTRQQETKLKTFKFIEKNKKYQTIHFDIDENQKRELQKQIMNRRNNVLKMKNISLVGEAGHLQLCAQKPRKFHQRLTYRQNNNNNLKKKYQIFLKKQKNYQSQFKVQGTLKTIEHYNPYKTQKVSHNSFFQTINPQQSPLHRKKIK